MDKFLDLVEDHTPDDSVDRNTKAKLTLLRVLLDKGVKVKNRPMSNFLHIMDDQGNKYKVSIDNVEDDEDNDFDPDEAHHYPGYDPNRPLTAEQEKRRQEVNAEFKEFLRTNPEIEDNEFEDISDIKGDEAKKAVEDRNQVDQERVRKFINKTQELKQQLAKKR